MRISSMKLTPFFFLLIIVIKIVSNSYIKFVRDVMTLLNVNLLVDGFMKWNRIEGRGEKRRERENKRANSVTISRIIRTVKNFEIVSFIYNV